jgi:hypothetical protein
MARSKPATLFQNGLQFRNTCIATSIKTRPQVGDAFATTLCMSKNKFLLSALLIGSVPLVAKAEGTAQLGTTQALRANTTMYVDILDTSVEGIKWVGSGSVTIRNPSGTSLGTLTSGQTLALTGQAIGAFRIVNGSAQSQSSTWDIQVTNATTTGSRLFSYDWAFDAGSFASSAATNASFYAIVDGGTSAHKPVIELKLAGLAGYVYNINANRRGVNGANAGRSVPVSGNSVTPEFPIYLGRPAIATYTYSSADVFGFNYIGGTSIDVFGNPMTPCTQIAPGASEGKFQFTSVIAGSYHLQCDLNHNGFSDVDSGDLLLVGTAAVGLNNVSWDGRQVGVPVAAGSYDCRATMQVGEFHYVGTDIETSYQGLRMYNVNADTSRTPLTMFWNDSAVQGAAINMPNGNKGLVTAGADGINSGSYSSAAVADVNAHSWGNFVGAGKGDNAFIDTYVWLSRSVSTTLTVTAVNPLTDTDGDGLSDYAESCVVGTDPADPDTDNDGTPDGPQYVGTTTTATNGGLESNGRLASQLTDREIRRAHGVTFPSLRLATQLNQWIDGVSLDGLTARAATPDDLVAVTNARETLGIDFVDAQGVKQASVLLIATRGAVYEHNKEICDRAHGATLQTVSSMPIPGSDNRTMPWSWFRRPSQGLSDFASSWKFYQQDAGYSLETGWLQEQYPAPAADQNIVNVQVWASNAPQLQSLVQRMVSVATQRGRLSQPQAAVVDDANYVEQVSVPVIDATPSAYLTSGTVLGTSLNFGTATRNTTEAVNVRVVGVNEQGQRQTVELGGIGSIDRINLDKTLPLFSDMTVEVYDSKGVVDRMWLSDGAWARFDDGLWGGETNATATLQCGWQSHDGLSATTLAGCAATHADTVDTQAGVARYLARPMQLDSSNYLVANVTSNRIGTLCLEASGLHRSSCVTMPAGEGWKAWRISDFDADVAAQTTLISFSVAAGGEVAMQVAGLATAADVPDDVTVVSPASSGGCTSSGPQSSSVLLLLAMAMWSRRRRG